MTDREVFRQNLTEFLNITGKTHKELADFCGVKRNTVTGWVHGASYPRADTMELISLFFGVRLSDLVMPKEEREMEQRLLYAWRTAEPLYQKVALEMLESHHILTDAEKAEYVLEREGFFDDKRSKRWKAKKRLFDAIDDLKAINDEEERKQK